MNHIQMEWNEQRCRYAPDNWNHGNHGNAEATVAIVTAARFNVWPFFQFPCVSLFR